MFVPIRGLELGLELEMEWECEEMVEFVEERVVMTEAVSRRD